MKGSGNAFSGQSEVGLSFRSSVIGRTIGTASSAVHFYRSLIFICLSKNDGLGIFAEGVGRIS